MSAYPWVLSTSRPKIFAAAGRYILTSRNEAVRPKLCLCGRPERAASPRVLMLIGLLLLAASSEAQPPQRNTQDVARPAEWRMTSLIRG